MSLHTPHKTASPTPHASAWQQWLRQLKGVAFLGALVAVLAATGGASADVDASALVLAAADHHHVDLLDADDDQVARSAAPLGGDDDDQGRLVKEPEGAEDTGELTPVSVPPLRRQASSFLIRRRVRVQCPHSVPTTIAPPRSRHELPHGARAPPVV